MSSLQFLLGCTSAHSHHALHMMCGMHVRKRSTATALCAFPVLKRLARFPLLPRRCRTVAEPQLPLWPGPRPWIWWPGERWLAVCCLFVRSERQIVCLRPAVRRC